MKSRACIRRQTPAFTLIELLVVIVILGILMAVAVPTFLRQQSKAQDSRTQQYLTTAYKAIRASTPDTGNAYPSSTSMVSWITQSEPELTAQRGSCINGVQTAAQDAVLVDPSSTANSLTLCSRSQSGNVWKLTATATSAPSLIDGTLVPFTFSGTEQTDTSRAAATQGDGEAPNSSTGIWGATTNLVINGGFETNTSAWWSASGSGHETLAQDSTHVKFGAKALKVTTDANQWEGTSTDSAASPSGLSACTSGSQCSFSAWVWVPTGMSLNVRVKDTSYTIVGANNVVTGNNAWQRVAWTITGTAGTQTATKFYFETPQAGSFWVDGVQEETGPVATPYVDTHGATAARAVSRVRAPGSLLATSQSWVAFRVRMGWPSSSPPGNTWDWMFRATMVLAPRETIDVYWSESGRAWVIESWVGGVYSGGLSSAVQTHQAGDEYTVVAYWTPTTIAVSVNGSAFLTTARGAVTSMAMPATFDIGLNGNSYAIDSDVVWYAGGTGVPTNADAATINSWGDTDPKRSSFPTADQATFVWDGAGANGSLK